MIASVFRPSDDATILPFLIPSNFMAVTSLRKAAEILTKVNHRSDLAQSCTALDGEVEQALRENAVVEHPKYGKIYAFEVDGFGNHLLMDDAARFTRAWFAWQNTLFGELVLKLIDNGKADLLNSLDD